MSLSPSLLQGYLLYRKDEARCLEAWHTLLAGIAAKYQNSSQMEWDKGDMTPLSSLLDAARSDKLPCYLKPKAAELDSLVGGILQRVLSDPTSEELPFVKQLLVVPGAFPGFCLHLCLILSQIISYHHLDSNRFHKSLLLISAIMFSISLKV